MRPVDNTNELIKKLHLKASADLDKRVHDDISRALAESKKTESANSQPNIWRTIMKSRIPKLAAAAVIVIVVFAGLPFFSGNGTGVVLADVLAKVEQARAFMYRMKMTVTGSMFEGMPATNSEMDYTVTISTEYGMKMEMDTTDLNTGIKRTQQSYFLPDKKNVIMIMPELKKYMQMELNDDLLAETRKKNNDPREMIKQFMNSEYDELGRSVIDGVTVEGFRTTDPAFFAGIMEDVKLTLWVDAEKWLPVRAEMDFKMNEQIQASAVIYDYQWDIPVGASDFELVIPEDFTALTKDVIKMPGFSEEAAIESLKFFADISGKYPKNLNMVNLMKEFSALENKEDLTDAGLKLQEETDQTSEEENIQKAMDMFRPAQSLMMFYMTLVQDKKEPIYYGESVGPDDIGAVLMRWKVSDGQYRVIFGDLSTLDVTAEELARLEKPLLEQ